MKSNQIKAFDEQYEKTEDALFINMRFIMCIFFFFGSLAQLVPYIFVKKYPVIGLFLFMFFSIGLIFYLYPYRYYRTNKKNIGIYEILDQLPIAVPDIFFSRVKKVIHMTGILTIIELGVQSTTIFYMKKMTLSIVIYPLIVQMLVGVFGILFVLPWERLKQFWHRI